VNISASGFHRCFVLASFLFLACVPASAQFAGGMGTTWNNPVSSTISVMITGKINEENLKRAVANRKGGAGNSKSSPAAASPSKSAAQVDAAVRFRPTATPLKARDVANQIGTNADEKAQMFALMNKLLEIYEGEAQRLGMPHDFAMALSVCLLVNSSVYHGTPEPEDAQLIALRNPIAAAMADGGVLSTSTDRQKQELYEAMVMFTMLAEGGYKEARQNGDSTAVARYRKLAGMNLQAVSGVTPDRIWVTSDGVRIDPK
jgi:hypothetical protein